MRTIEKLFKKYPLIYYIRGRYYALGTGVCAECNASSCSLEYHYKHYIDNYKLDLTQQQAWKIWHGVVGEAELVRDEQGICLKPEEEIVKMEFSSQEIQELENQMEAYTSFWKKYKLQNYAK